jgi:hypothetical protein
MLKLTSNSVLEQNWSKSYSDWLVINPMKVKKWKEWLREIFIKINNADLKLTTEWKKALLKDIYNNNKPTLPSKEKPILSDNNKTNENREQIIPEWVTKTDKETEKFWNSLPLKDKREPTPKNSEVWHWNGRQSNDMDWPWLKKELSWKKERENANTKTIELLESKKYSTNKNDYTKEEIDLLKQYTWVWWLNIKSDTWVWALSEFYTPKKIVDKMWDI